MLILFLPPGEVSPERVVEGRAMRGNERRKILISSLTPPAFAGAGSGPLPEGCLLYTMSRVPTADSGITKIVIPADPV